MKTPTARLRRSAASAVLVLTLLATPLAAVAHDSEESGHPVRIVAYVLHPVGVALDYGIVRPFHWLVTREPWRTIFGHTEAG